MFTSAFIDNRFKQASMLYSFMSASLPGVSIEGATQNPYPTLQKDWMHAANDSAEPTQDSPLSSAWHDGDVHGTETPPALIMQQSKSLSLELQLDVVLSLLSRGDYDNGRLERALELLEKIIERCEANGDMDLLKSIMQDKGLEHMIEDSPAPDTEPGNPADTADAAIDIAPVPMLLFG